MHSPPDHYDDLPLLAAQAVRERLERCSGYDLCCLAVLVLLIIDLLHLL